MELNLNQKLIDNIGIGLTKYNHIMAAIQNTDVSSDIEFQKRYNGFYRMRQRPAEYYSTYFNFMEKQKNRNVTFEETLRYLHASLDRIEASFSSKLVATINPNKPVWDEFVLQNLGIKKPTSYSKNRIEKTIEIYKGIEGFYANFLKSNECKDLLVEFDSHFPNTNLTQTKKVDLLLWQTRD